MNEQAFGVLEYDGLRALVRRGAQTPMGRARVDGLAPLADVEEVRRALDAVAECVELRRRGAAWSFSELADPAESIARLRIEGATLDALPLLEVARLCDQVGAARAAIQAEREDAPVLWELVADLPRELYSLAARVTAKILPSGELDDRASPELARIRHDINRLRSNITRSLENLMRRSDEAIQDNLVTVRNDRFVIPVRADHRGRVNGVAHGFSSSGATVFVEPLETIESNNELQNLRETEEREITRILSTLSDDLRRELPAIERAAASVAELDFTGAKAAMAARFNCVQPYVGAEAALELDAARHPLLEENLRAAGGAVVPVSFRLDTEHPLMVISGANAGGKTVVLKTAGLLALMALSGLHVPARAASFPFYRSVLADIGDSQSLAANLSTFTAHVANISRMLELCRAPALVLLDEVGTGTDPEEGSALGVAVVDHFRRACGAHVVATTHYSGLKQYAANETGVLNASVEFDERTLQPTYRLLVGLAGSSSGIEIAGRFGFPRVIVEAASARVNESSREATAYLRRIKRESEEAESLRRALEEERAAVAEKYATLERDAERRERERQTTFEREMRERLAEFEGRSKELFSKIEDRAERARVEREAATRAAELRRDAQRAAASATTTAGRASSKSANAEGTSSGSGGVRVVRQGNDAGATRAAKSGVEAFQPSSVEREIVKGDTVRLLTLGKTGVVERIAGADAEIRIGHVRLREKLSNLELMERAPQGKAEQAHGGGGGGSQLERMAAAARNAADVRLSQPKDAPGAELNLIGRTTDEAVDAADKFLDAAFLNGYARIRIIHGHGTGALRRAIADFLRTHAHVESFNAAPPDQGGAGATIVELKQ
ncbi:MAG: mismatch repair protein MutS2 [Pyrinomonadaceae bacterium]|jgi:DNA mismatch repair protein MutS2|nr:mismatch repair protein MutS2 [Pyrinomonadaceae bacterium]